MICIDTQTNQLQLIQNDKCAIQSIPNNSCIYPKSYRIKNQNKNVTLTENNENKNINNLYKDQNFSNIQTQKNICGLIFNNPIYKKSKQIEKNSEDKSNILLNRSSHLDTSKNNISFTNSIIFTNKEKTKEDFTQSALCNYFDKTPTNIDKNSENNNENSNNNLKCDLSKIFSTLNSDKKTPIKYSKNQFHNKNEDEYYDLGNNSNKNNSFNEKNKKFLNVNDNYRIEDRNSLYQKYEIDNETSIEYMSGNKNNEKINFDYNETDKNNSSKKKENEKLELKMKVNEFLTKKDNINDEIIEKQKYKNYCIESIDNINIDKSINKNINLDNSKKYKKIVVNRAKFYAIKPKINQKNHFKSIGITNFGIKSNKISNTNNGANIIPDINGNNSQDNTITIYHNYIDMNNNKQKSLNSPESSNTSTVIHVSNQKEIFKFKSRNSRKISKNAKIKKNNSVVINGKMKTEGFIVNKLNLNLSSRSSSIKGKNLSGKNDENEKINIFYKYNGEKIPNIIINKKKSKKINNSLKANSSSVNKIKIKKIDILNNKIIINTSKTSRQYIPKNILKNNNRSITNSNNNSFRNNKMQKISKLKTNNAKYATKSHSHQNINFKKLNKDLSKNKLINKVEQKILDGNNSQSNGTSIERFLNKNNSNKFNTNIAQNFNLIQSQRNFYINHFSLDGSNKMNDNLGKDDNEYKKSITSRNKNIVIDKYLCNTQLMSVNRRPTKIIQNFSYYKKKNNDKEVILDDENNNYIKTNSFIEE